ncbi:hypothetical protein BH24ACT15_BH24ACT15_35070 [soil metagenome]
MDVNLVLADPRTGQDVVATPPLLFGSTPTECPDGQDVCVQARSGYHEYYSMLRLHMADGSLVTEPDPIEGVMRVVGPEGLSDVRSGDVQYLARVADGAVVWQTPIDELSGPGYSTDGGWGWDYYPDEDLFVGSIGVFVGSIGAQPPELAPGSPSERDLTAEVTVAIDGSTASVSGGMTRRLPCARRFARSRQHGPDVRGLCNSTLPLPRTQAEDEGPVPVRCRYEGSVAFRQDEEPVFADLSVTVEGFDVPTGETTWTLALAAVEGLVFIGGVGAVAGLEEIMLPGSDGPVVVNLVDGATGGPNPDEVLGCDSEQVRFEYREPYYTYDGDPLTERSGGTLTVPCLPDGAPTADVMSPATIQAIDLEVAGRFVVATEGRLVGYQLG